MSEHCSHFSQYDLREVFIMDSLLAVRFQAKTTTRRVISSTSKVLAWLENNLSSSSSAPCDCSGSNRTCSHVCKPSWIVRGKILEDRLGRLNSRRRSVVRRDVELDRRRRMVEAMARHILDSSGKTLDITISSTYSTNVGSLDLTTTPITYHCREVRSRHELHEMANTATLHKYSPPGIGDTDIDVPTRERYPCPDALPMYRRPGIGDTDIDVPTRERYPCPEALPMYRRPGIGNTDSVVIHREKYPGDGDISLAALPARDERPNSGDLRKTPRPLQSETEVWIPASVIPSRTLAVSQVIAMTSCPVAHNPSNGDLRPTDEDLSPTMETSARQMENSVRKMENLARDMETSAGQMEISARDMATSARQIETLARQMETSARKNLMEMSARVMENSVTSGTYQNLDCNPSTTFSKNSLVPELQEKLPGL